MLAHHWWAFSFAHIRVIHAALRVYFAHLRVILAHLRVISAQLRVIFARPRVVPYLLNGATFSCSRTCAAF